MYFLQPTVAEISTHRTSPDSTDVFSERPTGPRQRHLIVTAAIYPSPRTADSGPPMQTAREGPGPAPAGSLIAPAVHRYRALSAEGILERVFTQVFKGLVYPQIWEDPELDLRALALPPGARLITIASGGCNVLSYLIADPAAIVAVDLNRAHVALTRLKLTAVERLPTYDSFYRYFGEADEKGNLASYRRYLRGAIDEETRRYWEGRDFLGRPRVTLFSRDLYRHGLLGYFIGAAHLVARLYGCDPRDMILAKTIDEQRRFFDTALAPLFDKRLVRWASSKRMSLYGLGIPPAQYEALAAGGDMASVLKTRLARLACGFALSENYFAWQAFGRGYESSSGPLPPYLQKHHFEYIRERAGRVQVKRRSIVEALREETAASLQGYLLLDAQDWMTDDQLNALWEQITRTAAPGARVVFRTAAEQSPLPGRVRQSILGRWSYQAAASRQFTLEDRSSIYGGVHLYVHRA
jgi:S-adenosylmethionine-diacylglycerol 3-amino-3-carboxypropyl transferase